METEFSKASLKIEMPVMVIFPEEIPDIVKAIREDNKKDLNMEKEIFSLITGTSAFFEQKIVTDKWVSEYNSSTLPAFRGTFIKSVFSNWNDYLLMSYHPQNKKEESAEESLPAQAERNVLMIGSAAVLAYAKMHNPNFTYEVKDNRSFQIPLSVMNECSPESWKDICSLSMRLGIRAGRMERMIKLEAPPIILLNEYRMLAEAILSLEDNGRSYYGEQVRPCMRDVTFEIESRSLRDVGYSLRNGWSKEMLEHFRKMEENIPDIDETEEPSGENEE